MRGWITNLTFSPAHNNLNGPLPFELSKLTTLVYLQLNNNLLTATIPTQLGELLTSLKNLNLASNMLKGTIPAALFTVPASASETNYTQLNRLRLSMNKLTGSIPTAIRQSQWDKMHLDANLLSGELPMELFEATASGLIDISFNHEVFTEGCGMGMP